MNATVSAQTQNKVDTQLFLGKSNLQQRYAYYHLEQKITKNNVNFSIASLMENSIATGHAFSLLQHPYSDVVNLLSSMKNWCLALILNVNIKTCTYEHETSNLKHMNFYVEDEHYVAPENAYHIRYQYDIVQWEKDYQYVRMEARDGPYDTGDYLFIVEIIPVEENRSFIHLAYSTRFGWISRLLLNTYLATIGRNKYGFTIVAENKHGMAKYIRGIEAIMERNTARYLLAFQAYLETHTVNLENRFMAGLNRWHSYTELFRPQLYELDNSEYISNKQKEFKNQLNLQDTLLGD